MSIRRKNFTLNARRKTSRIEMRTCENLFFGIKDTDGDHNMRVLDDARAEKSCALRWRAIRALSVDDFVRIVVQPERSRKFVLR